MKKTFNVEGMHCSSCSMLIEEGLEDIGAKGKADYAKGTVVVDYNEKKLSEVKIRKAITQEGYKVK